MTREEVIARRGEPRGDDPILAFGTEPGYFGFSDFTRLKLDSEDRVCGVAGANLEQDGEPLAEEAWSDEEDLKNLNRVTEVLGEPPVRTPSTQSQTREWCYPDHRLTIVDPGGAPTFFHLGDIVGP